MKTAKQMFEELGYKQFIDRYNIRYYKNSKAISFMTKLNGGKTVWGVPTILNVKLHQAIHQQLIELGWLK